MKKRTKEIDRCIKHSYRHKWEPFSGTEKVTIYQCKRCKGKKWVATRV